MAGPLTWRDVAAPDFSTAMQGVGRFSELINGAFSNLDKGITRFDNAQSEAVNKEAMLRLLAEQDAGALKTKLAEGTLFGDLNKRRLSVDTLQAGDRRVGSLLDRQSAELGLERDQYTFGKTKTKDAGRAAAGPGASEIIAAAVGGDKNAQAMLTNDPRFAGLDWDDRRSLERDVMSAFTGGLGNRNIEQNMAQGGERHTWDRKDFQNREQDRAYGEQATAIVRQAMQAAGNDPELAASSIMSSNLPEGVISRALGMVGGGGGGVSAASFAPGGAPSGGADVARGFNYVAQGKGYNSMPASVTTQGQARAYQRDMNRKGVQETAVGLYQIVGSTREAYGKKAFGAAWDKQPFNAQTDDRIARAIFEDPKHRTVSGIRSQWVGLNKYSNAQVAKILDMPWEQAREYISKVESPGGVSAGAVLAAEGGLADASGAPVVNRMAAQADAIMNNSGQQRGFKEGLAGSDVNEVVKGLVGDKGRFKKGPEAPLAQTVQYLVDNYSLTPGQAGRIIDQSAVTYNGKDWLGGNVKSYGNGFTIDPQKMRDLALEASAKGGAAGERDTALTEMRGQRATQIDQLAAQVQKDAALVGRIIKGGGDNPMAKQNLAILEKRLTENRALLQKLASDSVADRAEVEVAARKPPRPIPATPGQRSAARRTPAAKKADESWIKTRERWFGF